LADEANPGSNERFDTLDWGIIWVVAGMRYFSQYSEVAV